jgi:flagellar biosynthetic protein FliQ
MTPTTVVDIGRHAVEILLIISAPMLGAALVTGLLVSIFQAATQVNEMTLSFIPKLIVTAAALVLGGPFLLRVLTDYTITLFESIPALAH